MFSGVSKELRGLATFISDVRNCDTKEQEQVRVNKELANIRAKFTSPDKLSPYDQKKYAWKLVYIHMLGYSVDVGHMVVMGMVASKTFTVKQSGYLAVTILFNERSELLRLIIATLKMDLASPNDQVQALALHCIANIGGSEFAEALSADVQKVLFSGQTRAVVRKKAALALLRLFRKNQDIIPDEPEFYAKMVSLLDDGNIGVLTSVASLLLGVCSNSITGYADVPAKCVGILTKICFADARNRSVYKYYNTICPWLQVKLLKLLQYFPPAEDKSVAQRLNHVLLEILTKTIITKNVNKNNADHSILFEAVNVIIHLSRRGAPVYAEQTAQILGRFVAIRECNLRYLGLETMTKLALLPDALPVIRTHQATILTSLKDGDVSIRKRALDLLFSMCDKASAAVIVDELLKLLDVEAYGLREELVLKIAILAERYAPDLKWYVDVVIKLITAAGAFVTDDIWFRVVQIVANNEDLQDYASVQCYERLKDPNLHENGVKLAAYVLGEFGHAIRDESITGADVFERMLNKFKIASPVTKALMLTAFIKMANSYKELTGPIVDVFRSCSTSMDMEVQQRATEFSALTKQPEHIFKEALDVMPPYSRENLLDRSLKRLTKASADRDVWAENKADGDGPEPEQNNAEDIGGDVDADVVESAPSAAAPAAPAAAPMGSLIPGLDALLSGGVSSASASSSTGSTSASSSSSTNVFSFLEGTDNLEPGFPPQKSSLVVDVLRGDGIVIYESRDLNVAAKTMVEDGHTAKMILLVRNDSSSELTNITIQLPAAESLRAEAKSTSIARIGAGESERFHIRWTVLRPFESPPPMRLVFNAGSMGGEQVTLQLRLPLLLSTFCTPREVEGTKFIEVWKRLGNESLAKMAMQSYLAPAEVHALATKALGLAVVSGADANENNVCLAGQFVTATKNPEGHNVVIAILARIETIPNNNKIRVTVHAAHQQVSSAVMKAVQALFRATPFE